MRCVGGWYVKDWQDWHDKKNFFSLGIGKNIYTVLHRHKKMDYGYMPPRQSMMERYGRMIQIVMGMVVLSLLIGVVVLSIQVSNCKRTGSSVDCGPGTSLNIAGTECVATNVVECGAGTTKVNNVCVADPGMPTITPTQGGGLSGGAISGIVLTIVIMGVIGLILFARSGGEGTKRREIFNTAANAFGRGVTQFKSRLPSAARVREAARSAAPSFFGRPRE